MSDHIQPARLSETQRDHVLQRAAELDAIGANSLTVAAVREAAIEAGIDPAAFDQAVADVVRASAPSAGPPEVAASAAMPRGSHVASRLRALVRWPMVTSVARNAAALVGAYLVLVALAGVANGLDIDWLARKFVDPMALATGALLAYRRRARGAYVLTLGLAVATLVEFTLDVAVGAPAVRGFRPHMVLIVAGLVAAFATTHGGTRLPLPAKRDDVPGARDKIHDVKLMQLSPHSR